MAGIQVLADGGDMVGFDVAGIFCPRDDLIAGLGDAAKRHWYHQQRGMNEGSDFHDLNVR
ncbi:hypothetical protein D3C87_2035220 [compost metagenome]